MGVTRYRRETPCTWQDALELITILGFSVCVILLFPEWHVPYKIPILTVHLLQVFMFIVIKHPVIEFTMLTLLFDVITLVAQYGVVYNFIPTSIIKIDPSATKDTETYSLVKIGLLAGLLLIDLLRIIQHNNNNDVTPPDEVAVDSHTGAVYAYNSDPMVAYYQQQQQHAAYLKNRALGYYV